MTAEKEPVPLELSHPVIVQLLKSDEPVLIEECLGMRNGGVGSSRDPLADSGAALCFPIRAQGNLTAFVAFGKQLHGEAYGTDDCDLLSGIVPSRWGSTLSREFGGRTSGLGRIGSSASIFGVLSA